VGRTHPWERAIALLVENDPWLRLVMCDVLAQAGYRVAEASNGFSALRLAQREPLALVLLATDTLLTEVNRSRWRAANTAVNCGSRHTSAEGDRPVRSRQGWS
jgi:DNA-binding response OmpR family regulator